MNWLNSDDYTTLLTFHSFIIKLEKFLYKILCRKIRILNTKQDKIHVDVCTDETTTKSWIIHNIQQKIIIKKNRGQDTIKLYGLCIIQQQQQQEKKDSINSKLLPALFTGGGKLNFVCFQ